MQRIEIKGEQQTISEVFSERYAFEVPPYQRPYAWTTEQAGELLDDLLESLGEGAETISEMRPYFLGSIVLVKGERPESVATGATWRRKSSRTVVCADDL